MAVRGICHVAIGVTDPERSLAFYRDVVGLTVAIDAEEGWPGEPPQRRAIYLRWQEGSRPGFIVLDFPLNQPTHGAVADMHDLGVHHFAFEVDDVAAVYARAQRFGCEIRTPPKSWPGAAFGVPGAGEAPAVTSAILRDPDGNYVQFDQWLPVAS